jgi:hypothetical protein
MSTPSTQNISGNTAASTSAAVNPSRWRKLAACFDKKHTHVTNTVLSLATFMLAVTATLAATAIGYWQVKISREQARISAEQNRLTAENIRLAWEQNAVNAAALEFSRAVSVLVSYNPDRHSFSLKNCGNIGTHYVGTQLNDGVVNREKTPVFIPANGEAEILWVRPAPIPQESDLKVFIIRSDGKEAVVTVSVKRILVVGEPQFTCTITGIYYNAEHSWNTQLNLKSNPAGDKIGSLLKKD